MIYIKFHKFLIYIEGRGDHGCASMTAFIPILGKQTEYDSFECSYHSSRGSHVLMDTNRVDALLNNRMGQV